MGVERHAASLKPLYPVPQCDETNPDMCSWMAEFGTSTLEISVTNCGDFYVYYLQPTMIEALKFDVLLPTTNFNPNPRVPFIYCTTTEKVSAGNGYQVNFPYESF